MRGRRRADRWRRPSGEDRRWWKRTEGLGGLLSRVCAVAVCSARDPATTTSRVSRALSFSSRAEARWGAGARPSTLPRQAEVGVRAGALQAPGALATRSRAPAAVAPTTTTRPRVRHAAAEDREGRTGLAPEAAKAVEERAVEAHTRIWDRCVRRSRAEATGVRQRQRPRPAQTSCVPTRSPSRSVPSRSRRQSRCGRVRGRDGRLAGHRDKQAARDDGRFVRSLALPHVLARARTAHRRETPPL